MQSCSITSIVYEILTRIQAILILLVKNHLYHANNEISVVYHTGLLLDL
jgi:hypothetical protein